MIRSTVWTYLGSLEVQLPAGPGVTGRERASFTLAPKQRLLFRRLFEPKRSDPLLLLIFW